ncbi:hypothetical protein Q3G72_001412 [Acer saccharum]|nr:hypothetical protein Q3G72_001412 [Acer saccharum]
MDTPEEENADAEYLQNITIPSALISKSLGDSIKKSLIGGEMVNMNLDWTEAFPLPLLLPSFVEAAALARRCCLQLPNSSFFSTWVSLARSKNPNYEGRSVDRGQLRNLVEIMNNLRRFNHALEVTVVKAVATPIVLILKENCVDPLKVGLMQSSAQNLSQPSR